MPFFIDATSLFRARGCDSLGTREMTRNVVEHLHKEEIIQLFKACHRALRPLSCLVLSTPNAESLWGVALRYADFTHEVCFGPKSLCQVLYACGFRRALVRETGPIPLAYGWKSTCRYILWQALRFGLQTWKLVETGTRGDGILTRVFVASAVRSRSRCCGFST